MVHLSDISWNLSGEDAVKEYKKGQDVEAVILAIDAERERISLGIKQLVQDPFNSYVDTFGRGTIVTGEVIAVDAKVVTVKLADEVEGTIRASELSTERVEDASQVIQVGESIDAKITNADRKSRTITLSVKAKDAQEQADVLKQYTAKDEASGANTSLGDLLKAQMENKSED